VASAVNTRLPHGRESGAGLAVGGGRRPGRQRYAAAATFAPADTAGPHGSASAKAPTCTTRRRSGSARVLIGTGSAGEAPART